LKQGFEPVLVSINCSGDCYPQITKNQLARSK
jgi:hypothetical protein